MNNIWQKEVLKKGEKPRKGVARRSRTIEHTRHNRRTKNRPSQAGATWHGLTVPRGTTVPHGTVWPCHVALARLGWAVSLAFRQCFGTVTPCLWARPCHPRSASRLKSSSEAVSVAFRLYFSFLFPELLFRRFLGFSREF